MSALQALLDWGFVSGGSRHRQGMCRASSPTLLASDRKTPMGHFFPFGSFRQKEPTPKHLRVLLLIFYRDDSTGGFYWRKRTTELLRIRAYYFCIQFL
jgi:hypothetical protein